MTKNRYLRAIITVAQVFILAIVLLFVRSGAHASAQGSIDITGTISGTNGAPVADASIFATDPNTGNVVYGPVDSASDGTYDLPVTAGTYNLYYDPPGESGYTQVSETNVTVLNDQTINIQFTLGTYTLSGTITDQNGTPIPGMSVGMSNASNSYGTVTNAEGQYSMTVTAGTYTTFGMNIDNEYNNPYVDGYQIADGGASSNQISIDMTSGDVGLNFSLNYVTMTLATNDSSGNPDPDINVNYYGSGTTTIDGLPFTTSASMPTVTGSDGTVTDYVMQGVTFNSGDVCASYPGNVVTCTTSPVTASDNTTAVSFQEPATYTYSGTVTDQNGDPLSGMQVGLGNGSAITNAQGQYSMILEAGDYTTTGVSIDNETDNPTVDGYQISDGGMSSSAVNEDLTTGNVTQNFVFNYVKLNIDTNDSSGNPDPNIPINYYGSGTISVDGVPYTVSSNMPSSSGSNGVYTGWVLAGVTFSSGDLCATFPSGAHTCTTSPVTMSGDQTVTFSFNQPAYHTLSGTITDQNGNPIPDLGVGLGGGQAAGNNNNYGGTTNASGQYSFSAEADTYSHFGVGIDNETSNPSVNGTQLSDFNVNTQSATENLTTSNATQNLAIPLVTLTIITNDSSSNPESGVNANFYSQNTPITIAGQQYNANAGFPGVTGSNGAMTVLVPQGLIFSSGDICATYPNNIHVCDTEQITANNDVTVIFEQGGQVVQPLSAPTNLSATSPTQYPALTWDAESGATSYNVYRNGTKIASTTTNAYTDTSVAPDTTYSYYVTAVNAVGESPQSNTVNVTTYAVASALALSPAKATGTVGGTVTFTATATSTTSTPVPGITVRYSVTGSDTTNGSCVTASSGTCTFSYTGPQLPGTDQVAAYADNNNNGQEDPGEPTASATTTWSTPASTAGTVTGTGTIRETGLNSLTFSLLANDTNGMLSGDCIVVDPVANDVIDCTSVSAVTISGKQATLFGNATLNGTKTTYRIDVTGNGSLGQDTFKMVTASGYTVSGTVSIGTITVL